MPQDWQAIIERYGGRVVSNDPPPVDYETVLERHGGKRVAEREPFETVLARHGGKILRRKTTLGQTTAEEEFGTPRIPAQPETGTPAPRYDDAPVRAETLIREGRFEELERRRRDGTLIGGPRPKTYRDTDPATVGESVSRGVDIAQQLTYGAIEATGELVLAEPIARFGRRGRERNRAEIEAARPRAEFTKIESPREFGQWAKEVIGEQVPIMAPSIAGAFLGGGAGSAVAGPPGTVVGALIGAFIPSLVLGVGEVQTGIKERDPQARAPGMAFAGGSAIAALDSILPGKVGGRLMRTFGRETAEEIATRTLLTHVSQSAIRRTATGAATGMATEGVTEALQEAIEDVTAATATEQAVSPTLVTEMVEAGAAGALLGGVFGGTSSLPSRGERPVTRPPTPPPVAPVPPAPVAVTETEEEAARARLIARGTLLTPPAVEPTVEEPHGPEIRPEPPSGVSERPLVDAAGQVPVIETSGPPRPRTRRPPTIDRSAPDPVETLFDELLTDATAQGYAGSIADLRRTYDERLDFIRTADDTFEEAGRDSTTLLREIAKAGGIGEDPTLPGERAWLQQAADLNRRGRSTGRNIGGVSGVLTKAKDGLTFGGMLEHLRQDPRFTYIDTVDELINEIVMGGRKGGDVSIPLTMTELNKAGIRRGTRWWEDQGDVSFEEPKTGATVVVSPPPAPEGKRPTTPAELDAEYKSLMEQGGAKPRQRLLSKRMEAAGGYSDEQIRRARQIEAEQRGFSLVDDITDTDEVQPRLPEAGAVREQEVATPEFEVPFALTPEAAQRTAVEPGLNFEAALEKHGGKVVPTVSEQPASTARRQPQRITASVRQATHRNNPGFRVQWADPDPAGQLATKRGSWFIEGPNERPKAEAIAAAIRRGAWDEANTILIGKRRQKPTAPAEAAPEAPYLAEKTVSQDRAAETPERLRPPPRAPRAQKIGAETGPLERLPATIQTGVMQILRPVSPVELTRLVVKLLGSSHIFLKRYPQARGMFYPDPLDPRIGLHPELGKDYEQFAKTLAHEAGHLVDYLPEGTLERGNILGRIATLRNYLAHTINELPSDAADKITPQDRKRLQKQARKEGGPKPGPDEGDAVAEWNAEVRRIYQGKVEEEMDERGLIGQGRVREELLALTRWWTPYDPEAVSESHRAYRESSKELYAEAVSVLLNSPGALQERAPTFFESFLGYLERKPAVREAYEAIQDLVASSPEEIAAARTEELETGFQAGEERLREADAQTYKQPLLNHLAQLFVTRGAPVYRAERKRLGALPPWSPERTVRMALQEYNHADNVNRLMLTDLNDKVHQPLLEAGIRPEQMGQYLALRRIAEGDRGGMAEQAKAAIQEMTGQTSWAEAKEAYAALGEEADADLLQLAETGVLNPYGYTPQEATTQLQALSGGLGEAAFARLEKVTRDFRAILFRSVETAVELGVYNRETFEQKILPNRDTYATFAVLDYFTGRVTAGIRQQIGTVKGIANPYTAMILKTMSLNRLNESQKAKMAVLEHIEEDFPGMAGVEKPIDKFHRERHPERGRANLHYLVDGKLHTREVDEYIAKVFDNMDLGSLTRLTKVLSSTTYGFFHPLYVTWSIAWQARNIQRDIKRTYKNLSVAHAGEPTYRQAVAAVLDIGRLPWEYAKVAPQAWRHARRRSTGLLREMLADKALGRAFHSFDPNVGADSHTRLLERYGILKPEHQGLRGYLRAIGSPVETMGVFQETWAKAAAYQYLGDRGITGRERAYMVRNYIGTPDSLERGLASEGMNALYMYANVITSGIRADAEVALHPTTASGYWLRSVLMDYAPKMMMAAAVLGWLGDDLKDWYDRIPSYDLEKYLIVPIWPYYAENEQGDQKSIYLRLPHDDVTRILAAALWTALVSDGPYAPSRAIGTIAGEFPGVNPALSLVSKWVQVASGRNPYDEFRGRDVIPRTQWAAGGWARAKEMLRYSFGELGIIAQILGRYVYTYPDNLDAPSEKLIRSIPGLSTLVKITDRGLDEKRYWDEDKEAQVRAQLRSDLSADVRRATAERSRLNRFGDEVLSRREQLRRQELNDWYRTVYVDETALMEFAKEEDRDAMYEAAKDRLDASVDVLQTR